MIQNSVKLNKPFIGVSLQYRLNAYGFVDSKEVKEAGATNLGIRDQRMALQWVKENIAAFGGDDSKVSSGLDTPSLHSCFRMLTAVPDHDLWRICGRTLHRNPFDSFWWPR